MPKSDWLRKPAARRSFGVFVALLLAVVIGAVLWLFQPQRPAPQVLEPFESFFSVLDPECAVLLAKPESASGTPNKIDDCEDKAVAQRKGYRDLKQAIRAANAAEDAAWLSLLQTRASIVGAAFLVLTLFATGWAAWAAADAASIAIRAADAAEQSVTVARETAKRQLRAYMSIELTRTAQTLNADNIGLHLRMINRGQTPAYGLIQWNRRELLDFPIPERRLRRSPPKGGRFPKADIMPNDGFALGSANIPLSPEDFESLKKGGKRIYTFGAVYFRDAFGRRRYSRYCYTIGIRANSTVTPPELHTEHNNSN